MKNSHLQPDLLFCRQCRRHFRGKRRECPTDGSPLELVTAFLGQAGDELDGRYVLIEQIGVGGMGSVFLAHDKVTDRDVALKLLRADYASNASSAQRFLQEAKLLRQVHHRSVVGLHRFSRTDDGMLLIDMELVDGESVRDRILSQGAGFDYEPALLVLDQLLSALAACHDVGVIHCDVKPENLMLPRAGGIAPAKLVDFGVAQAAGPVIQSHDIGVIGTPAYMSPEQVRGAAVDARTDLYLVGCVAYELLSGEPPFTSQSAIELCHDQMLTPAPSLRARLPDGSVPEAFEAWLLPLMAKDPQLRPPNARAAREQLRALLADHRRSHEEDKRPALRPPSAAMLARTAAPISAGPAPARAAAIGRGDAPIDAVRALVEIRQAMSGSGVAYGPEAIEQIVRHVLAANLADMREIGAEVGGPVGQHIDLHLACNGDERGAVSHLLDALAAMQAQLGRIPEPRLELRAAVVAELAGAGLTLVQGPDPLALLGLSPLTQVRVDEHIARWSGRRALVRLTSVAGPGDAPIAVYAASLHPT